MCSKFQSSEAMGRGVYTFRVNGELCHHIGNLEPEVNHSVRFAQIYFLDDDLQTDRRWRSLKILIATLLTISKKF